MLVFIDDSGDTGFKLHSSPIFIIVLVIFDDNLVAEETALAIKKLRRELKFPDKVEFRYSKSRLPIKKRFLQIVAKFPSGFARLWLRKLKCGQNSKLPQERHFSIISS